MSNRKPVSSAPGFHENFFLGNTSRAGFRLDVCELPRFDTIPKKHGAMILIPACLSTGHQCFSGWRRERKTCILSVEIPILTSVWGTEKFLRKYIGSLILKVPLEYQHPVETSELCNRTLNAFRLLSFRYSIVVCHLFG